MDDLSGLDWTSKPRDSKKPSVFSYSSSAFPTLRPTPPGSGRSTPHNVGLSNPPSKPTTPANDSFSNLVSFGSSTASKNISLHEQQKRLAELREQQNEAKAKQPDDRFYGGDDHFWNNLGSGRSTPAHLDANQKNATLKFPNGLSQQNDQPDEGDFLAPLSSAPGNASKRAPSVGKTLLDGDLTPDISIQLPQKEKPYSPELEDDDDPFGLNQLKLKSIVPERTSTLHSNVEDDDVLGLLGQPVSVMSRSEPEAMEDLPLHKDETHPQAKAVAELIDMGFPADQSREALESTESGVDVQAAVGLLLKRAHAESRMKAQARADGENRALSGSKIRNRAPDDEEPASIAQRTGRPWVGEEDKQIFSQRHKTLPASSKAEKDPAQLATDLGTAFLKTAGSLWKQGSKRVQQAVQDFNSDSDSSQPRWMRESERQSQTEIRSQSLTNDARLESRRRRTSASEKAGPVTDEALMLEPDRSRMPPRQMPRTRSEARVESNPEKSRDHSPAMPSKLRESNPPQPTPLQQQPRSVSGSKAALSRQAIEEQAAKAYVSSARRRKPAASSPVLASEPNLLDENAQHLFPDRTGKANESRSKILSEPIPVRTVAPARVQPSVSAVRLKASHSHREAGTAQFKRGDYASAHQSYTTAISHLPPTHLVVVVLLTNRALTALKIGQPKAAVADADTAIGIIGPSKGEREAIDLGNGEASKPMRDYYGKALMRKAEALEQMERWKDAADVWREAVDSGHGGATSIQGRIRAEKAANPKISRPNSTPAKTPPAASLKKPAANSLLRERSSIHANSAAAVNRLRAANAAAEKADDEKFALADSVDARLAAWKGGKADNLRALLGSLDAVLWPEAGWKKISMADLVLPHKVKIQYMKGIAKVHPDKIPTSATTEQKMIAGAVFSTLNEAWDKFKDENSL